MNDLAPEMVDLLRAGAEHVNGVICLPGQVRKLWPLLSEAKRLKLITFLDVEHPIITDMGRRAIGAPTEIDAGYARFVAACMSRKRLTPTPDKDPRTDFDYRSYKSCGYVCCLVVRQPDGRYNPPTIRVGNTLTSDPQFLGPKNSQVLPECEGTPFVLALMPKWLIDRTGLSTYPVALDDNDGAWSADDRKTWARLRDVCFSVNSRIRSAGRRTPTAKLQYGQYA
jgi:hypothetical protein